MRLTGSFRLWIVVSSLWSIGWILWIVWLTWIEGTRPIPLDLFLLPFIVLSPWLITASVFIAKWVVAGFRPSKSN